MPSENPITNFGWTALALLLLYIFIEGWGYANKPSAGDRDRQISQSLDAAQAMFQEQQTSITRESNKMAAQIQERMERGFRTESIYQYIREHDLFWGITLYRNSEPHLWDGFAYQLAPGESFPPVDSTFIEIQKENNVVYWQTHTGFTITDSSGTTPYHLYTGTRIEQKNALPIGENTEYHFTDSRSGGKQVIYPVQFNFFNPFSGNHAGYRVLQSAGGDSLGAVYAESSVYREALIDWEKSMQFWRHLIILLSISIAGFLGFRQFDNLKPVTGLVLQLLILLAGWLLFNFLFLPGEWLQELFGISGDSSLLQTYHHIIDYLVDSVFIFLLAWALYRKVSLKTFRISLKEFPAILFTAGLAGLVSSAAIQGIVFKSYRLVTRLEIPLFKLQLIPPTETALLLVAFGLMFLSLYLALVTVNRFLLISVGTHYKSVSVILSVGFILGLVLSQLLVPEAIRLNWASLLTIFIFFAALGMSLYEVVHAWSGRILSPLRITVIMSMLIALTGTPVLYQANLIHQDQILKEKAREFATREDPYASRLTEEILLSLGEQYRDITEDDLSARVPFIQSSFTNTVEQSIALLQRTYSLDLQLIRPSGKLVASYSTDLNSPDWTQYYDLPYLTAVIEQQRITKSTNRPVVQMPQLANREQYKTFYRGWLALFGNQTETPIGWILCSVYQERPNYNKPIRAVMASLTSEDWRDSYHLSEYGSGVLQRQVQQGVTGYFPIYNVLLPQEQDALQNNSEVFYTRENETHIYRNYLWLQSPATVIKTSTIYPDLKTVLFEFFKLSFIMLVAGIVFLGAYKLIRFRSFEILGSITRFQHRILDSFLMATLLFLGILVVTSQYVILHQNQNIVRQELVDKLESLGTSIENSPKFQQSLGNGVTFSLDSLASPLNADASFYNSKRVTETTTPQIYRQHLLQEILPYSVYRELYIEQKQTVLRQLTLASQPLLVGYRIISSPRGEPVAALSIPTFFHSPKYNQQLLETTSYLIVLYLVVFGIFMMGTVFIARQLSHPLEQIQKGLNKISRGELDIAIPVTSNDEIGNLAAAYNEMVSRLKELRSELAAAEREAAWKEMAQQVAHEIKNPLTPMKLNVQHLKRQLSAEKQDPEQLRANIEKITQNLIDQIQSLNNIASDFSKFSKPINEDFVEIPVNEIIESVAELYQHDENVTICRELTSRNAIVFGVRDELKRAVINLVKNAFEATHNEGEIRLRTYVKDRSIFIEIEDNGQGIPEEDKSRIFVPNFSTKSSGTGLGLAITKKIIEAHKGSITFASIEGEGTTFIIKLPTPD